MLELTRSVLWELRLADGSTIILCSHHMYQAKWELNIRLEKTPRDIPDAGTDPNFQCSVCKNEVIE